MGEGMRTDVQVRRLKVVLLASSLVCLGLLLLAAFEENLTGEWRSQQKAYRAALVDRATDETERKAAEAMEIGLQQLFLPPLDRIDRCTTCHIGIEDPAMAGAALPLRVHGGDILEHHPPDKFGCTVCHDGQGRAVDREAAHGDVAHWPAPLLAGGMVYTSCSRCHYENDLFGAESDLYAVGSAPPPIDEEELESLVPGADALRWGKALVAESGCLGCHRYRGRGGTLGPDITFVGDKGPHDFDFKHIEGEHTVAQWLLEHFKRPQAVSPGTLMPDMELTDDEARDLTVYMLGQHRKNMPAQFTPVPSRRSGRPASGERFYAMFCSSCHGSNGRGSTVRDPLLAGAADVPPELMVPSLNHPDTLGVASDGYLKAMIRHGRPGTNMPAWAGKQGGGLRSDEVDRIVSYIRGWEPPGADLAAVSATRGDPAVGRTLYRMDCASCHGPQGQGGIGPSLSGSSFLAVASDLFLARTILHGRPDTAMSGYRHFTSQQLSDLIANFRTWHPKRNDREEALRLAAGGGGPGSASVRIGQVLYRTNCAVCHGPSGEGDLGPSLSTPEFLTLVGDDYLYETIDSGRPGTGMPAWHHLSSEDVASLILYVRSWQKEPGRDLPAGRVRGDWDAGLQLFRQACASCHGERAEGGTGPQLRNPVFLRAATDAMLRAWISKGKAGTPMRAFLKGAQGLVDLSENQIADVVAYIRSLEREDPVGAAKHPTGQPDRGAVWYAESCASCHGPDGEGASGPSLSNPGFLRWASDGYLTATMALGRDGTPMRPVKAGPQSILSLNSDQINDIVAHLRSWEVSPPFDGVPHRFVVPTDLERGRRLYVSMCSGCHGLNGRAERKEPGLSAWAPELNNEAFLAAATDGFLQATIVRGRTGTAMRSFGRSSQGLVDLSGEEVDDIVAYIRRWSSLAPSPETLLGEARQEAEASGAMARAR